MINFKKDSKGARFGSKTSTLEMVGIVLPFLLCPNFLHNQHVVFSTDNIGCYFGWLNMSVSGDITASTYSRESCTSHVVISRDNCACLTRAKKIVMGKYCCRQVVQRKVNGLCSKKTSELFWSHCRSRIFL